MFFFLPFFSLLLLSGISGLEEKAPISMQIHILTYTNDFAIYLDEKRAMFQGIPVGLSLVARRLEEEKVVAMLQLITDVAGLHHV